MNTPTRTALVTGAASGIGKACATALADAGLQVIVADIDPDRGQAATAELRDRGRQAEFMPVDMSDPASIDAFETNVMQVLESARP